MATTNDHFKVDFIAKHIVKAPSPPPSHTQPLSTFDLLGGRTSTTVFYAYRKPHVDNFSSVLTKILTSLAETLNHYPLLAGRLLTNPSTGEPEILFANEGVEVTVARAYIDLACLDYYDPSKSLQNNLVPPLQDMPLRLQVTSYTCGGFSMAWNTDHALVDAASFSMLVLSWSEIAQMRPLSRYPNHQRSVFKPRLPLKINPSFDHTFMRYTIEDLRLNAMPRTSKGYDISVKGFYFIEASDIDRLQAQASQDGGRATKIEAFSAYLWKILGDQLMKNEPNNNNNNVVQCCKMAWLVDGRRRMASYDVQNLFGNLLTMAVGEANINELNQLTISSVANKVHNAIAEVSNEAHFLDLLDWIEFHRPGMFLARVLLGLGGPAIVLSDARRVPVKELDFGFGGPVFGSVYTTAPNLGAGYVSPQMSGVGDGSWVVFTILWPELVAALESDPNRILKPMSASRLGF